MLRITLMPLLISTDAYLEAPPAPHLVHDGVHREKPLGGVSALICEGGHVCPVKAEINKPIEGFEFHKTSFLRALISKVLYIFLCDSNIKVYLEGNLLEEGVHQKAV